MAIVNCPKCGHTISDKAKNCISCGYCMNYRKKNRRLILFVTCPAIILALLFITTLITSHVGQKQYFKLISEQNFLCVIGKHRWMDATCEYPMKCSICESEKGSPIGHKWKNADCENPKTCLYCKETQGEPLGHTVNIGFCKRCNEYVNEYEIQFTVIKESMSVLEKSFENIKDDFHITADEYIELYYCNLAKNEAINIKKVTCVARDACGDIPDLADLRLKFSEIDEALNGQIDIDLSVDNYMSYANDLSKKIYNSVVAYNEMIDVYNKLLGD